MWIARHAHNPRRCCNVVGCLASPKWQQQDVSYFPVPTEPHQRSVWLKALGRDDDLYQDVTLYVCERHFRRSDIVVTSMGRKRVIGAVPTLHLPRHRRTSAVAVQAGRDMNGSWAQTTRNFKEDNLTQVGTSFAEDKQQNSELLMEIDKCQNDLDNIDADELRYHMEVFQKSCDKFLSPPLSKLAKDQMQLLADRNDKSNLPILTFYLNLYHTSPTAYKSIQGDFQLPTVTTLINKVLLPISSEVNDYTIAPLQNKVSNMDEMEKYCTVMVDVMPLKTLLSYNKNEDRIVGLHEIDGVQELTPARHAVVVLARGLFVQWMQPIGFSFISDTKSSEDISRWIDKILIKLLDSGLRIKAFVCKQSKHLDELNIRSVNAERPYFYVNDSKIYYVFDTPYMIRQLRNVFLTHDFQFDTGNCHQVASFGHIKHFYEMEKKRRVKFAPKLTDSHITPTKSDKKKTIYAMQLFSSAVAVGLASYIEFKVLQPDTGTVDFVLLMNNLFNLLNISGGPNCPSRENIKIVFQGGKSQVEELEETMNLFKTLELINRKTGVKKATTPAFVEGFQITIKSVMSLCEEFQTQKQILLTRRLSLEVMERFIKKIKPKGQVPVIPRFVQRFRKLYLGHILKPAKLSSSSDNLATLLCKLNDLSNHLGKADQIRETLVNCEKELPNLMVSAGKTSKEFRMQLFCGFLLKKCADYHTNCEILSAYVAAHEVLYGLEESESEFKPEPISIGEFNNYVASMEGLYREGIQKIGEDSHIEASIYKFLRIHLPLLAPSLPCPCFPVKFLQKLFIRLRTWMIIDRNNSVYRGNRYAGKNISIPDI